MKMMMKTRKTTIFPSSFHATTKDPPVRSRCVFATSMRRRREPEHPSGEREDEERLRPKSRTQKRVMPWSSCPQLEAEEQARWEDIRSELAEWHEVDSDGLPLVDSEDSEEAEEKSLPSIPEGAREAEPAEKVRCTWQHKLCTA